MELQFFSVDNAALYRMYLGLKATVFIEEMQWEGLDLASDRKAAGAEENDKKSVFLGCMGNDGSMIGMIRGTALCRTFPHRDYFEDQLDDIWMQYLRQNGFTMNALAVEKSLRGREFEYKGTTYKSVGRALVSCMSRQFFDEGYEICVVTAIEGASVKVFRDVGFRALGSSFLPPDGDRRFVNLFKTDPSRIEKGADRFPRPFSSANPFSL